MKRKDFVKNLFLINLCLFVMIGMAFGEGKQEAETVEPVLRWSSGGDVATYDPMSFSNTVVFMHMMNLYDSLTILNDDLELTPSLAESWELLDETTWQIHLRKNVTFHDGRPFTSEDVKFSIERAAAPPSAVANLVENIKEVKIIDPYTMQLITYEPFPLLMGKLTTLFIMSKGWCEEHNCTAVPDFTAGEESYSVRNTNGTGPFMLVSREPDVETVWVKNPNWWGLKEFPDSNIDRVIFTPIANDATRVAALISGEIDFLHDSPLQDVSRIKNTPGLKLEESPHTRNIFFGLDAGSPELRTSNIKGKNPFADVRVREAINRAIDRETIKEVVMRGMSFPLTMPIAPAYTGYPKDLAERDLYDPDRAKQLLIEAGYPDGFEFSLNTPNNRYINDEAISQAVVGMLGKVGIKVNLISQPLSIHFPALRRGEYDMYMLGLDTEVKDSYQFLNIIGRSDGIWNFMGYCNPDLDKLVADIAKETNEEKRLQMIQDSWEIFAEDWPVVPMHAQYLVWAMRDNVDIPIRPDNMVYFVSGNIE
ncbi:ABC transporter substrate-binding protein [Marispirochaeta aestuarii]|uniref:ABC transporter substrate-binding protein n=2 Tax=Marispirochaeta TaxID=1911565 RepID=UPI0029C988EE|nr:MULTISPECIES: ABC transporter substrate-binding protein [Marispirochaeta]